VLTRDNNVSKTLILKNQKSLNVYNIIGHWDMRWRKKWRHFWKAAFSFSGWIGLLKTWQDEYDGYSWKINAIWWNIKINLQKSVDMCEYELPINLKNFTPKDLTGVKFRGGATFFLKHPVYQCRSITISVWWRAIKTGDHKQYRHTLFCE